MKRFLGHTPPQRENNTGQGLYDTPKIPNPLSAATVGEAVVESGDLRKLEQAVARTARRRKKATREWFNNHFNILKQFNNDSKSLMKTFKAAAKAESQTQLRSLFSEFMRTNAGREMYNMLNIVGKAMGLDMNTAKAVRDWR